MPGSSATHRLFPSWGRSVPLREDRGMGAGLPFETQRRMVSSRGEISGGTLNLGSLHLYTQSIPEKSGVCTNHSQTC